MSYEKSEYPIKMKKSYKSELRNLININGRRRIWVSDQFGIPRSTFWRRVNMDSFNEAQKAIIAKVVIHGTLTEGLKNIKNSFSNLK